jgi:glutamine amidotransferase
MPPKVTLVDYGIGNLLSVRRGFEHFNFEVVITDDPKIILNSERVVLPGVGSFLVGMSELAKSGLDDVIRELASKEVPVLAICLGMQLLFEYGEERGLTAGLGLIPGRVVAIPTSNDAGPTIRVPHIGWNAIYEPTKDSTWKAKVLQSTKPGGEVYFNHSFMAIPSNSLDLKAICNYGGRSMAAVVQRGSVTGCQFHPEKSGEIGLMMLKNFVNP